MDSNCKIFTSPSKNTDMSIVVDGTKLYVNKIVLTLISPVWDNMIHAHSDNGSSEELEIRLPGKKVDDICTLLMCTYPSTVKSVTEENIDVLLPLAEEFQIDSLKDRCENFIVNVLRDCESLSTKQLIHMLILSDTYSLARPLQMCTEAATKRNFNEMKKEDEFSDIRDKVKYQFMSKRLERYDGIHAQVCTWSQKV